MLYIFFSNTLTTIIQCSINLIKQDSGFGAEDEYSTYSKPMFDREGVSSSSIYRPTRGEGAMDADEQYAKLKQGATSRFQPDKGFSGAEGGNSGATASGPRNAPVQFEKGETK